MKVKELVAELWNWANPALQESYDNSSIIVGDPNAEITGVIVSLDCIEEVVDEAINKGCNCIVSHHPIVFKGLKTLTGKNYVERTVLKAIKHDVAIVAMHTNLDNVDTGVNRIIGEKLGLQNLKILSPKPGTLQKLFTYVPVSNADKVRDALFLAGAGKIGNYDSCSFNSNGKGTFRANENANPYVGKKGEIHFEDEVKLEVVFPTYLNAKVVAALKQAHPYEEVAYEIFDMANTNPTQGAGMIGELPDAINEDDFLATLKETFTAGVVKHTKLLGKKVKKVAFCGGAGSFLLNDAIRQKADVFFTGDVKYHEFFDAEEFLVFADIGHFESEQFTVNLLGDFLKRNFTTFATHFTEVKTNPVNYF